ncbi:hypothetical protein FRC03_007844 [Tulasnella sp. 419]|nr:hypothetical protein FRC03_007844 [Tulasnella sp. 419]
MQATALVKCFFARIWKLPRLPWVGEDVPSMKRDQCLESEINQSNFKHSFEPSSHNPSRPEQDIPNNIHDFLIIINGHSFVSSQQGSTGSASYDHGASLESRSK